MLYPINDIFYSIQGEGFHVGKPAVFIRLAGCNLKCPWCDTNHSQKMKLTEIEIRNKVLELSGGGITLPTVVITGGEPSIYDLRPLTLVLSEGENAKDMNWFPCVHVETNGTGEYIKQLLEARKRLHISWITLSPKYQKIPDDEVFMKSDEIKVILDGKINPDEMIDGCLWDKLIYGRDLHDRYFIQPCSENYKPAVDFVMKHPQWRLSVQIQKVIGVR